MEKIKPYLEKLLSLCNNKNLVENKEDCNCINSNSYELLIRKLESEIKTYISVI